MTRGKREMHGIFNWVLAGWRRLRVRGHFVQPASAREATRELEDLGSPITAFLRDRCEEGPGLRVECSRLFEAWRAWCADHGRDHAGTPHTFGRALRAILPGLRARQLWDGDSRIWAYEGLRLLT